jgi:uncharacterized protein involved in exopolysaccharide biosynthesis
VNGTGGNFWRLLEVAAKRRGLILSLVMIAAIISAVVSLFLPSWYEAEAVLLPPHDLGGTLGGSSTLGFLTVRREIVLEQLRALEEGGADSSYFTVPVSAMPALKGRYRTTGRLETYNELIGHTRFAVTDEGLVTIRVEDRDPETAAAMANAYIDELNRISADIVSGRARQNKDFVAERLRQVEEELSAARTALEEFQTTHKAIDFDEQTRLAIEQAVSLKVSLAKLDMDIELSSEAPRNRAGTTACS